MGKYLMAAFSVALIAAVFWLIWRSTKRKAAAQNANADLGQLIDIAALSGVPVAAAKGQYVATVFADKPLERVVTGGFAYRGKAQVIVTDQAIGIERVGEESFAIPASSLLTITRKSSTIDRAVEADGLTSIQWRLGETVVDTLIRIDAEDDTADFESALLALQATNESKDGAR